MNKKIVSSIRKKRIVQFICNGKERIVEPQTYGISAAGKELLRAYQRAGSSTSGQLQMAKLFKVKKILDLKTLRQKFERSFAVA